MKDIIKYFKLLKYGLQIKTMVILSIVFFALGIVYECVDLNGGGIIPFSGLYMALSGMYIYQVVITTTVSSLVQVSSMKKKLQCGAPVFFTTCCLLITYTAFVVIRLCITRKRLLAADPSMDTTNYYLQIVFTSLLIAFLFLYFSFSYRFYIISTVILCVTLFPLMLLFIRSGFSVTDRIISFVYGIIEKLGGGGAIALSYAIILLGALLCYLVNLALYRRPIQSIAFRTALRQAQAK
ncbi:MAG: hypothetical protein J5824_09640 [Lachnospiraceae bacterium]|nr:hypothetical protein [Lachnospiraceae bacterium]